MDAYKSMRLNECTGDKHFCDKGGTCVPDVAPCPAVSPRPQISSGVIFKLNTIWPTKITTHWFYYYIYEPIV